MAAAYHQACTLRRRMLNANMARLDHITSSVQAMLYSGLACICQSALVSKILLISSRSSKTVLQAVHLIFNRWEPLNIPLNSVPLLSIPGALSAILPTYLSILTAIALASVAFSDTLFTSVVLYRIAPVHPFVVFSLVHSSRRSQTGG